RRIEKVVQYAKDGDFATNGPMPVPRQFALWLGNILVTITEHSAQVSPQKRLQWVEEMWPQYARYANMANSTWAFADVEANVAKLYAAAGRPGEQTQLLALKMTPPKRAIVRPVQPIGPPTSWQ